MAKDKPTTTKDLSELKKLLEAKKKAINDNKIVKK